MQAALNTWLPVRSGQGPLRRAIAGEHIVPLRPEPPDAFPVGRRGWRESDGATPTCLPAGDASAALDFAAAVVHIKLCHRLRHDGANRIVVHHHVPFSIDPMQQKRP